MRNLNNKILFDLYIMFSSVTGAMLVLDAANLEITKLSYVVIVLVLGACIGASFYDLIMEVAKDGE